MRRRSMFVSSPLMALLLAGCTATSQTSDATPSATTTPSASTSTVGQNLQVLRPADRDELIKTMKSFTRALGVRCDFCHVRAEGGGENDMNFPSDANPHKDIARTMIRMTQTINRDFISKLPAEEGGDRSDAVVCMTCHRGNKKPDISALMAPRPQPAAPGGS